MVVDNNEPNMNAFFNPKPNTIALFTDTTVTSLTYVGLKHHLAKTGCEQSSGRELIEEEAEAMGSSRWNPTAEQLLALEEKYRCGTRTPTTDQIIQIASELRRFGKIEAKNVFYWFQNHKARERQKRRPRQGQQKHNNIDHESLNKLKESGIQGQQKHNNIDHESLNKLKESGLRRTVHGLDQTKNLVPHSNCSEHAGGPVTVHGAAIAERGAYGWSEFEERELQQIKNSGLDMHEMRQTMDFFSSAPVHHLTSNIATTTSKFLSLEENGSLLRPTKRETHAYHDDEIWEVQTLQLFPLCSNDRNGTIVTKKDRKVPIRTINTNFSPSQYFEFLPLKN